jgi:dipeptidyl-peptidase-4
MPSQAGDWWQSLPVLLLAALMTRVLPAAAGQLTIEAIFGDKSLDGRQPVQVTVSPDGTRVGFLRGTVDDQYQLDLWEYNLAANSKRLLVDSRALAPHEQLSATERARRERERTASLHGIVEYHWSPDGKYLLFPLAGELYLYDLRADPAHAVRRLAPGKGALTDPRISPRGRYVSYVRDQNLYVIDLRDGRERALTHDGGGTVHNGEAEFVAQEEMDRYSGYWWAPDDSAIAFERYDEHRVPKVRRFELYADHTEVIEQRYPAAGGPNASVHLGLVAPSGGRSRWVRLGASDDLYLARVNWLPDGRSLSFQRVTRDQRQLDLVRVDARTLRQATLLTERSPAWVNLNDDLRFLVAQPAFIWSSDRSGSRQLYLYDLDGHLLRRLTEGDWTVRAVKALDEHAGRVWFSSNQDFAPGNQLYSVALDGSEAAAPRRVSEGAGWHSTVFPSSDEPALPVAASLYVDTAEDPATPPATSVHAPDGHLLAWIEQNTLDAQHPYWPYRDQQVLPEFGTIAAADGQRLWYSLLKPPDFDPTRRYPVMIDVYGGPQVQNVTARWTSHFNEYMAQHGYLVFTLDNRGADGYGRRLADAVSGQLGNVEVEDQLAGAQWLAAQPWVDAGRIGAFGWSYGGYMTVMMLARHSEAFAAGVAVAPVTDWTLYDTFYTERYLGKPQEHAEAYGRSSVFPWLKGLTSPLLVIHGMADDNVLFTNTTRLLSALQEQGTPFQLMTYPGGKHGLSTTAMRIHAFHAIAGFFDEQIGGETRTATSAAGNGAHTNMTGASR